MNKIIVALLAMTSVSAFAENRIIEIQNDNPNATPYKVMEQFYNESTKPAVMYDVDLVTDLQSNQQCVVAMRDSKEAYNLIFARENREIIVKPATPGVPGTPGQPSQGPLFPGTPPTAATPGIPAQTKVISTFVFSVDGDRKGLSDIADSMTGKDLVTADSHDLIDTYTDPKNTESVVITRLRENGGMLAIKATLNARSRREQTVYGYCYRE